MSVYLDRRVWLGYIGDLSALPECAVHEWRVCTGLDGTATHKQVLEGNMTLASQPVPTDPTQLSASHLGLVAHFLNPAQAWRKKCLLEAWQFVLPFMVAPPQLKGKALPPTPMHVGWPTNEAPRTIPAARLGEPDEFGQLCAYLASAQAGYITGQNFVIDGGAFPGAF